MAQVARALVAPAQGKPFEIQDVQINPIRPDEALVEIHAVGVCHADLSCQQGKLPVQFPLVLGHEGMFNPMVTLLSQNTAKSEAQARAL